MAGVACPPSDTVRTNPSVSPTRECLFGSAGAGGGVLPPPTGTMGAFNNDFNDDFD